MSEVSDSAHERSRKAYASVLQGMKEVRQTAIAAAMGISESTVSRIKNEDLEGCIQFLYHAGWKLVPQDYQCVPEVQARAWLDSHRREVQRMSETEQLWPEV
ncbi:hypothetical protein [Comamonas testosteroni]|uniref:Uncharacterized protein n=1 Tax=Comamonas testosteroni TaxID=285 RepID=A0A096F7F7_COMTE|nr:hypothetical protein [Comamonas testosteroni]KGH26286.1 hypothetical protein P353_22410 [Comamonas testosteroni]